MILQCGCTQTQLGDSNGAKFQDNLYGKGNRVCNPLMKDKKGYRCSICGKLHLISVPKEDKKK